MRQTLLPWVNNTMSASPFRIGLQRLHEMAMRHRSLIVLLLFLFSLVFTARLLQGNLFTGGGPIVSFGSGEATNPSLRTCSSKDTVFETMENLGDIRQLYRDYVSAVVRERERLLRTPSVWKCGAGADGEPDEPKLKTLAGLLPGWNERVQTRFLFGLILVPKMRPVTFDTFSAVLGEFQREYECKLTELQDRTIVEVARNQDIEKPAQFCCTTDGCQMQINPASCFTPMSADPQCDGLCVAPLPTNIIGSDAFSQRTRALHDSLGQERATSRVAMERTLQALRSFNVQYAVARQLVCYERASLDLRAEMSLLADAVSCMPKIWDAVTSIHD